MSVGLVLVLCGFGLNLFEYEKLAITFSILGLFVSIFSGICFYVFKDTWNKPLGPNDNGEDQVK